MPEGWQIYSANHNFCLRHMGLPGIGSVAFDTWGLIWYMGPIQILAWWKGLQILCCSLCKIIYHWLLFKLNGKPEYATRTLVARPGSKPYFCPLDFWESKEPLDQIKSKYAFPCRLTAHIWVCNLDSKPNEQNRSSICSMGTMRQHDTEKYDEKNMKRAESMKKKLDPLNFERPSRCSMVFPGLWLVQSWNSDPNHKPFQPSKGSVR